jgi:hypothetical protein
MRGSSFEAKEVRGHQGRGITPSKSSEQGGCCVDAEEGALVLKANV